jgi:hypothetical protein
MSLEGNAPLEDEMEVYNANRAGPLTFEGFRSKLEIVTITGGYRDDESPRDGNTFFRRVGNCV